MTFSLLKSILTEEAIETQPAEELWLSLADTAKAFLPSTMYFVRKEGGGLKYEVMVDTGTIRRPFAKLSKYDLDKAFEPLRPKQIPDAEGYIQYRKNDAVEAIQFKNSPIKVQLDNNSSVLLTKGDYLVRAPEGSIFVYSVMKEKDFETAYSEQ